MKTRLLTPYAVWLLVCGLTALLVLSACRGPAPITGRVDDTATPAVRPETPTPPATNTPAPTETATPVPEATATPTETPPPTATNTPAPTETATPAQEAPATVIEGLKLMENPQSKKMEYVAEKGNPYGVKAGEVVGYPTSVQVKGLGGTRVRNPDGSFEEVGFAQQSAVVIRNQQVLAHLMKEANTTEKVQAGEWRIPLPFVPGHETRIEELKTLASYGNRSYMAVNGLPKNNAIVNPFSQSILARSYPRQNGVLGVSLFLPDSIVPEEGINYSLGIMYSSAEQIFVDNTGKHMGPGTQLIKNITGQVPKLWAPNAQVVLVAGSRIETKDFAIARNVLTCKGSLVFVSAH